MLSNECTLRMCTKEGLLSIVCVHMCTHTPAAHWIRWPSPVVAMYAPPCPAATRFKVHVLVVLLVGAKLATTEANTSPPFVLLEDCLRSCDGSGWCAGTALGTWVCVCPAQTVFDSGAPETCRPCLEDSLEAAGSCAPCSPPCDTGFQCVHPGQCIKRPTPATAAAPTPSQSDVTWTLDLQPVVPMAATTATFVVVIVMLTALVRIMNTKAGTRYSLVPTIARQRV